MIEGRSTERADPSALGFLSTRRSPKLATIREPGPNDHELEAILIAASHVPDHGQLVPWRFVVVRGGDRSILGDAIRRRFDQLHPEASSEQASKARSRLAHAPVVIALVFCPRVHSKVPEWEQILTVGAVGMNLLHACRAMGFDGLWLTEWYAYDAAVLEHLGLDVDERVAGFFHVGTATHTRTQRLRPKPHEVITVYRPDVEAVHEPMRESCD